MVNERDESRPSKERLVEKGIAPNVKIPAPKPPKDGGGVGKEPQTPSK